MRRFRYHLEFPEVKHKADKSVAGLEAVERVKVGGRIVVGARVGKAVNRHCKSVHTLINARVSAYAAGWNGA